MGFWRTDALVVRNSRYPGAHSAELSSAVSEKAGELPQYLFSLARQKLLSRAGENRARHPRLSRYAPRNVFA
jgi:hypothetical protein